MRLICFFIVTPWEIGVILTANYTFLNYLVLALGFLLLDDKFLLRFVPARFRPANRKRCPNRDWKPADDAPISIFAASHADAPEAEAARTRASIHQSRAGQRRRAGSPFTGGSRGCRSTAFLLTWIAYDTTAEMIAIPFRDVHLPAEPIVALEPFRIANQYGLFAVMTRGRYEIEFQGSNDGVNWTAYPFRNKPQALNEAPRIYAPYQPRFDWNLWFASLGDWRENEIVPLTEERLLLATTMCSRCSAAIHFRSRRRAMCARCCGNTGLLRWTRSAAPATGGGANRSAFTRRS